MQILPILIGERINFCTIEERKNSNEKLHLLIYNILRFRLQFT